MTKQSIDREFLKDHIEKEKEKYNKGVGIKDSSDDELESENNDKLHIKE